MRKFKIFSSFIITVMFVLATSFNAFGANPKYVCMDKANTSVNLNTDVLGNDFNGISGTWDWVKNTVAEANLATYNPAADAIQQNYGNLFVLSGKTPGIYKFVFTATSSACIAPGTRKLAVVHVVQQARNEEKTILLCTGQSGNYDLRKFIDANLLPQNDDIQSDPTFTGTLPTGVTGGFPNLSVDGSFEGKIALKYAPSYTVAATAASCVTEADLIINVKRIATGDIPTAIKDNISMCVSEVPSQINLNQYLKSVVAEGVWTVSSINPAVVAPTSYTVNGRNLNVVSARAGDVVTLQYAWTSVAGGCLSDGNLTVTLNIKDNLTADIDNGAIELCRNTDPNRVVDMLKEGLGTDIPLSTGTWTVDPATVFTGDITDGKFELVGVKNGTYNFKFTASPATNACGLGGDQATLTIKVNGAEATPSRIKFCLANLENDLPSTNLNLNNYLNFLPSTATGTWTAETGSPVVSGTNQVTASSLAAAGKGVYKYTYDDGQDCGVKAPLYITVTDKLDMSDKTINYCRPDIPAGGIDLVQAIGVHIPGNWALTSSIGGNVTTNGVFTETGTPSSNNTYTITFTPTDLTQCGAKAITVTIKISDNNYNF